MEFARIHYIYGQYKVLSYNIKKHLENARMQLTALWFNIQARISQILNFLVSNLSVILILKTKYFCSIEVRYFPTSQAPIRLIIGRWLHSVAGCFHLALLYISICPVIMPSDTTKDLLSNTLLFRGNCIAITSK